MLATKLPSVSLLTYHVSVHLLPVFIDNLSWQTTKRSSPCCSCVLTIMHVKHIIYRNTQFISGCAWILGTSMQQMWGNRYLDYSASQFSNLIGQLHGSKSCSVIPPRAPLHSVITPYCSVIALYLHVHRLLSVYRVLLVL